MSAGEKPAGCCNTWVREGQQRPPLNWAPKCECQQGPMAHTVTQWAPEPILSTVLLQLICIFRILCLLKHLKNKSCHHCFTFPRHFTISAPSLLVSPISLSGVSASHLLGQIWRRETKCSQVSDPKSTLLSNGDFWFNWTSAKVQFCSSVGWICSLNLSPFTHTHHTFYIVQFFFKTVPNPATELDSKWVDGFYLKVLLTQQMHLSLKKCKLLNTEEQPHRQSCTWKMNIFLYRKKKNPFWVRNNSWSSWWRQCWELKGND